MTAVTNEPSGQSVDRDFEPLKTAEARSRARWWRRPAAIPGVAVCGGDLPQAQSHGRLLSATGILALIAGAVFELSWLGRTFTPPELAAAHGLRPLESVFGRFWLLPPNSTWVVALASALFVTILAQARSLRSPKLLSATGCAPRFEPASMVVWSFAAGALAVLVATVLGQMAARARFPMDLLIWSESSFVQDMIKLRQGLPTYSDAYLNNSYVYNPGAPIVTWAVASPFGRAGDLAFCRQLQVVFVILACVLAWSCSMRLARNDSSPGPTLRGVPPVFSAVIFLFIMAVGVNPHTSPWIDLLHNDALSILTTMMGLTLLIGRERWKGGHWLLLAATVPALAVFVKQTGAVVGLGLVLGVWVQDRRLLPALRFGVLAALCLAVLLGCLAVWSDGWWFHWTVRVLSKQPMRLRMGRRINGSVILPMLPLIVACVTWVIWGVPRLPERQRRVALSAWVYTILLVASATFTSFKVGTGAGNHWGPAGLVLACLASAGCVQAVQSLKGRRAEGWANLAAGAALVAALIPLHGPPYMAARFVPGVEQRRYVTDLDRAFQASDTRRTLLDHGSLPYLRRDVVPRDRCSTISETNVGRIRRTRDLRERVRTRHYDRILIHRGYGEKWYGEQFMSLIRDHYDLSGTVPGADESGRWAMMTEILIFEPKRSSVAAGPSMAIPGPGTAKGTRLVNTP